MYFCRYLGEHVQIGNFKEPGGHAEMIAHHQRGFIKEQTHSETSSEHNRIQKSMH